MKGKALYHRVLRGDARYGYKELLREMIGWPFRSASSRRLGWKTATRSETMRQKLSSSSVLLFLFCFEIHEVRCFALPSRHSSTEDETGVLGWLVLARYCTAKKKIKK